MSLNKNLKLLLRKGIDTLMSLLPIDNRKIVLSSYYGAGFGENLRYISEEINNRKLEYKLIWLYDLKKVKKSDFPKYITPVKYRSFRGYFHLATAKFWLANCRKAFSPPKKKTQFYLQLWHGPFALKKIEADASNLPKEYADFALNDSKKIDLFISNSRTMTQLILSSFWYSGEVLECGYPRTDNLMKKIDCEPSKKKIGIDLDSKVILYTPTFRSNYDLKYYDINFDLLLNQLSDFYNQKFTILIRLHPNISLKSKNLKYSKSVINVSSYDVINDLIKLSDILITDYSSVMFDSAILRKQVILYTPDLADYFSDRGFYYDLNSLPFPIVENKEDIFTVITQFDFAYFLSKIEKFFIKEGLVCEMNSASVIVDRIESERIKST